ncbi:MAG: hypothetical protein WBP56_19075 [Polyangia bacterium]
MDIAGAALDQIANSRFSKIVYIRNYSLCLWHMDCLGDQEYPVKPKTKEHCMLQNAFETNSTTLLAQLQSRVDKFQEDKYYFGSLKADLSEIATAMGQKQNDIAFAKYNDLLQKLDKAEMSAQSGRLSWILLSVQVVYLAALVVVGYLVHKNPNYSFWSGFVTLSIKTVWFGALGGVTIAIFGIYNHVQKRDFDPGYTLWYVCKPIIGGIFGWFVYLVYFLGFVAIQSGDIKNPQAAYLISFLAGFSERFTIVMVDKLMSVLTTFDEGKPSHDTGGAAGKK